MIWSRLKNIKCPKCNGDLTDHGHYYKCKKKTCDFHISTEKFNGVVKKLYLQKERGIPQYGDNDEALNNARW